MSLQVRSLVFLGLALFVSACSVDSKTQNRTCIYNDVEMDCNEFDRRFNNGDKSDENQTEPTTPVTKPAPAPKPTEPVSDRSACLNAASSAGLFRDQMATLCSTANAHTASCISAGSAVGLFREHIVSVCANSRVDSASCIRDGSNRGLFRDDIVRLCQ